MKLPMGKINYGKYLYIITPLEGKANKHSITKLEKALMNKDTLEKGPEETYIAAAKNYVEKLKSVPSAGRVDILFYYGSDVYWPTLYVSGIASEMNSILSDSNVATDNTIYSVGVLPTGTTFPGECKTPVLDQMENRLNEFSNIDQEWLSLIIILSV